MEKPYSESGWRRSLYWVLLVCSVIGFLGVTALSFVRGGYGPWLGVFFAAGLGGMALLSIWCAVNVTREPDLVRVALLFNAALFVFLIIVIVNTGNVH